MLVTGEERVIFASRKPATFKILSPLSDIICITQSFVCAYVTTSVVFDYFPRGLSWLSPRPWDKEMDWIYQRILNNL